MTKRILLMLTLFALLLTCSCSGGTQATVSDASAPTAVSEEEEPVFTPPEYYATVLSVNINPSFTLYLADGNEVIAMQPNNDDARQMMGRIDYINRGIGDVMDDIVQVAVDDGYLKEGGKVAVDVSFTLKSENEMQQMAQHIAERVANRSQDSGIAFEAETTATADAFQTEFPGNTVPDGPAPASQGNSGGKVEGCSVCWGSGRCGYCGAKGTITCENCSGKGYFPCHRCEGTGGLKCGPCKATGICPRCGGDGRMTCDVCHGSDPNCSECRGSGEVDCRGCVEDLGKCSQCKGTGRTFDDQCNGTGKEPCGPCNGTGITDCSQCHGSGKCPACNGTGKKR